MADDCLLAEVELACWHACFLFHLMSLGGVKDGLDIADNDPANHLVTLFGEMS